jgi:hypothetical protein
MPHLGKQQMSGVQARRPPLPYGHIDRLSDGVLYGWAWNPCEPSHRLNVDVFHAGCFMGQFAASFFREDLQESQIGDGRYAFRAHVPDGVPPTGLLDHFEVFTSFPNRVRLLHPGQNGPPEDEARGATMLVERVRDMFLPTLLRIASGDREVADKVGCETENGMGRRPYEDLIGQTPIKEAFLKSGYDTFIKWYLENYCAARGKRRAPLSSREIAYLNEIIEVDCVGTNMTRAASLFMEDRFGLLPRTQIHSGFHHDELIYWWSVEESRKLFVEDRLVIQEYIELLKRVREDVSEYPLSIFMEIFISRNSLYRGLSAERVDMRRMTYFIIMLYAIRIPHFLSFLPGRWLKVILEQGARSKSQFDELVASVFGRADLLTSKTYAAHMSLTPGGVAAFATSGLLRT